MYHVRYKLFLLIVFVVLLTTFYNLTNTNYRTYTNERMPKTFSNLNLIISQAKTLKNSPMIDILQEESFYEPSFFETERFKEVIIHLDLKGAPPNVLYLLNFIPFVKKLGATGLLIEYEDMFPYHDGLEDLRAQNAYTLADISLINESAEKNNLTVIPLVQTFGHFEFVLKLEKYKGYREVPTNPQALCPHQKRITAVVEKMISQVMDAHPHSKYFHIGCDEVISVGLCPRCQAIMKQNKWRKGDIYFLHVKNIAQFIIKKSPTVRPIIWGDEVIEKNEKLILRYDLPKLVDVMLWNYKPNPTEYPKKIDMQSNAKLFKSIWVASAFKGSTGMTKMVPVPQIHYKNNKGWIHFASQWKNKIKFKGIVITGWQRYNHFAVLCELLPVAMPSLALSVQALTEKESNFSKLEQTLECNNTPPLTRNDVRDVKLLTELECSFSGFDAYYYIHLLNDKLIKAHEALEVFNNRHLLLYNVLSNFSDPYFIKELSSANNFKEYLDDINDLERKVRLALSKVYDEETIAEWIMTYVLPLQFRLEAATRISEDLLAQKTWPNRPFTNSETSVRDLFKTICGPLERRGCGFLNIF